MNRQTNIQMEMETYNIATDKITDSQKQRQTQKKLQTTTNYRVDVFGRV